MAVNSRALKVVVAATAVKITILTLGHCYVVCRAELEHAGKQIISIQGAGMKIHSLSTHHYVDGGVGESVWVHNTL